MDLAIFFLARVACGFPSSTDEYGEVLNPIALLQIAVSAQKLHITCCTGSALTVRNDVIKL
jgi:hypothetical protein